MKIIIIIIIQKIL